MRRKIERPLALIFGSIIAEKRKLLGMSQEELAEQVGITQVALSRMEKGEISPKFERLQIFANTLGCSVAELFPGTKEMNETAILIADMIKGMPPPTQKDFIDLISRIVVMARRG